VEPAGAALSGRLPQTVAQWFLAFRTLEQAVGEGSQVQTGSPGDDGQVIARTDAAQGFAGEPTVITGSERMIGVGNIDEMMLQPRAFLCGGLGSAEIHAAIDRNGIAADDFAVELLA